MFPIKEDQLYLNNLLLNLFPLPFSLLIYVFSNPEKPDFNNIFIKKGNIYFYLLIKKMLKGDQILKIKKK
ncbi:unnamed protein product [Meloidogyne enterolobii]|uniref:Uncharacterized protein n=1 Tax=Meloidogyne enterolobii TaxID=390850 RepID=A0ACB1B1Q7_MELEN